MVDKDETQAVQFTDVTHNEEAGVSTSPKPVIDAQKCPTKWLNLPLNTQENDICPSKSERVCEKTDSSTKTKECVDVACKSHVIKSTHSSDSSLSNVSSIEMLLNNVQFENEQERKVLSKGNEFLTDCHQVCSGAVFPSFSRATCESSRSDLDTISAMYAQVSQHCQLDATDFINTPDHHFSENEEPRLVIDTDFGCTNVQCRDNDENYEHNDERNASFCFDVNTKIEDKCSHEGRLSDKQLYSDRNSSLCESEVHTSPLERLGDRNLRNSQHFERNLIAGRKRERKRLVVNVKRGNSSTGADRQSRKRKQSRIADSRFKSAADVPFVKISSKSRMEDGCYISKHSVSKNNNRCQELSEMNGGQVSEKSDKIDSCDNVAKGVVRNNNVGSNCDKVAKGVARNNNVGSNFDKVAKGVARNNNVGSNCDKVANGVVKSNNVGSNCDKVPTITHSSDISCANVSTRSDTIVNSCDKVSVMKANMDSSHGSAHQLTSLMGQPNENNTTCLEHIVFSGKEVKNQHTRSYAVELNMNPSALLCASGDGSNEFQTPTPQYDALPHQCSKKKKLEKSLEYQDFTLEGEAQNKLQYMKESTYNINYQFSDISKRTSLASKSVEFDLPAGQKCEVDQTETGECQNILMKQKKLISTSFENTVKSDLTVGNPGSLSQVGNVVGRRYECPVSSCNVTFCRRWNMKDHMMKVHAQSPLIVCSVTGCDLKFSNKRELRQHITVDHMGKIRKYMCSWPDCSKGFFARTHLSIHMLTHTGEKPVACNICDYRCRQRTALIWHLRKHGVFHKVEKVKNLSNSTTSGDTKTV